MAHHQRMTTLKQEKTVYNALADMLKPDSAYKSELVAHVIAYEAVAYIYQVYDSVTCNFCFPTINSVIAEAQRSGGPGASRKRHGGHAT